VIGIVEEGLQFSERNTLTQDAEMKKWRKEPNRMEIMIGSAREV
jgi:hypothetical protein